MKDDLLLLPGYKLYEYLIVIEPNEELREKIKDVKNDFVEKYDAAAQVFGKPQMAVLKFSQLKLMEKRIVSRLQNAAMTLPPLQIKLKDFGSYPTHSIFIKTESKGPLKLLQKQLKTMQTLFKTKETKPHFFDEIHFTVAQNLLPWQYEKGWIEYGQKHFTGSFLADNMHLLCRPEGTKKYTTLQTFQFLNKQVEVQASLF